MCNNINFKDNPLHFAEASNAIQVLVVVLPGLDIAICHKYHLGVNVSVFPISLM